MSKQMRLPRNFHKTFIPERQYIHAMLRFAASGRKGTYQEIASVTGIPMGKSSGKVPAILDYCRGMGLIKLIGNGRSAVKRPELTPFGRIVFLEDPHLKERITQWIAHFNLCSVLTGAETWYQTFFAGSQVLGMRFHRSSLEEHLSLAYKCNTRNLIGPVIRMYEDDAAFSGCGVLSEEKNTVVRRPAPINAEYGFAYGAWVLQLIADHFPKANHITLAELDNKGGWKTIPGWNIDESHRVIELIERKGIVAVDRQMTPWIIRPLLTTVETWGRIYDDLI
jgi:hypothetical protein